jgi:hypothetical protein
VHVELRVLAHEASRIRRLPDAEVRRILREYAQVRFDDREEGEAFVRRELMRKRSIETEAAHFIRQLRAERRQISGKGALNFWQRPKVAATVVWNHWQVVLQRVQRGKVGTMARHVLTHLRAKSAGVPADLAVTPKEDASS